MPAAKNKTQQTSASVDTYLGAIADAARRADCEALTRLMSNATKQPPAMWGTSIVGFGSYHYKYASGREGDTCVVGFSSRKADISIYGLNAAPDAEAMLARLGKIKTTKGCVHLRRLADVDQKVLEKLIAAAARAKQRQG